MTSKGNGLFSTLRAMRRVKKAAAEAAMEALAQGANEVADLQRALAPVEDGDLKASITVTMPGQRTPAFSQPGGQTVVGPDQVLVTAGNEAVRYAHIVEHGSTNEDGTTRTNAKPFFFPGYRIVRRRVRARVSRTYGRVAKREWNRR